MVLSLKQLTMLSILLVIVGSTVNGCASSNYVTQIEGENALIKYTDEPGYEDRFSNIYESFKAYPVTCTSDCYPASGDIECESNMQDCRFVGNNPAVNLHIGFTFTWLGHASFLLNTAGGEQILIDPVFGQFDWPVNLAFRLAEGISRNEPAKVDEDKLAQTDAWRMACCVSEWHRVCGLSIWHIVC